MGPMKPFTDPVAVDRYAGTTAAKVPGLADLQRMAAILLAERAPAEAEILVLGAGGGAELAVFAAARPGWTFLGVDPSRQMLDLARDRLGPYLDRIRLLEGYIDDAPDGPFDGAACLLTLHFLPRDARLATLRALHRRMRPGAALVVAHHSLPDGGIGRREGAREDAARQARRAGGAATGDRPAGDRSASEIEPEGRTLDGGPADDRCREDRPRDGHPRDGYPRDDDPRGDHSRDDRSRDGHPRDRRAGDPTRGDRPPGDGPEVGAGDPAAEGHDAGHPAGGGSGLPEEAEALRWLARSAAFAGFPATDPDRAAASAATMARLLPLLPAAEDAALIAEAGFADVALFYAGFTFRGWVGVA